MVRPYYGGNICGDMIGDLGFYDYINHIFPDIHFITAASIAKSLKVNLKVIDANAEKKLPEAILKEITESYDVILVKVQMPTIRLDIEFLRCLKKIFPVSRVIAMGSISFFLKDWLEKNTPEIEIASCKSVEDYVYELITGEKRHLTLDEMPAPDYMLFPYKNYVNSRGFLRASLYTSRGCTTNCDYCHYTSYYKGMYEERSLEKLGDDIERQIALGFKYFAFRDQNFSANKKRIIAICEMIKDRGLDIKWETDTRIDKIDKDTLDIMVEAGLEMISFGVETASNELLEKYHRPVLNRKDYKDIVSYAKEKGINTLSFYILGFPGQTWDSIESTFELALDIGTTYANFNVWNLYVGTKVWEEYKKYNEITPEKYALFTRTMKFDVPGKIDSKLIDVAAKHFTYKYIENMYGLEGVCHDFTIEAREKQRQGEGYRASLVFFNKHLDECKLGSEIK
jgi:radical SAM superfamily enzyme YgiQ (UPF0313 family)